MHFFEKKNMAALWEIILLDLEAKDLSFIMIDKSMFYSICHYMCEIQMWNICIPILKRCDQNLNIFGPWISF